MKHPSLTDYSAREERKKEDRAVLFSFMEERGITRLDLRKVLGDKIYAMYGTGRLGLSERDVDLIEKSWGVDLRKWSGKPWLGISAHYIRWLMQLNDFSEECINWPFYLHPITGYSVRLRWAGKYYSAHKWMCIFHHGEKSDPSLETAHSCGNKLCVNPKHLRWATHQENMDDRELHGTVPRGERAGTSKLTEDQVLAIKFMFKDLGYNFAKISRIIGAQYMTVRYAALGKTWAHVPTLSRRELIP